MYRLSKIGQKGDESRWKITRCWVSKNCQRTEPNRTKVNQNEDSATSDLLNERNGGSAGVAPSH